MALTVLDTQEVAINPVKLAGALRARVAGHPRIEARLERYIIGVENDGRRSAYRVKGRTGGRSTFLITSLMRSGRAVWQSTRLWG